MNALVDTRELHRRRRATLLRLKKVNAALRRVEEYEASFLMPPDIRPYVCKPVLGRTALESLRNTVESALVELETTWEAATRPSERQET